MSLRKIIPPSLFGALKYSLPVRLLYRRLMARSAYLINCELTTRCNLSCRMCSRPGWVRQGSRFKVADMPKEVLERVLAGIEELKDKDLVFMTNGLGEPLLYPGLLDVVYEARRRAPSIKFSITTNAVSLDEKIAARLIEAEIDEMTISVSAGDRVSYRELMGADLYDKVVANTTAFIELRKRLKAERPCLSLQFLRTTLTRDWEKAFYKFWEPRLGPNDKIFTHEPVSHAGAADVRQLKVSDRAVGKYPCSQCWSRIAIRINGDIYPCDASYYACEPIPELQLGNVLDVSLKQVYFGEDTRIAEIRNSQLSGDYSRLGPCARCDTFKLAPNAFFHIPFISKRKWH